MRVGILMMMLPDSDMYVRPEVCTWLEAAGLELVLIPPTVTGAQAAAIFDYIHGLFIHPGEAGQNAISILTRVTTMFLTMALEAAKTGDYFPVWGTCHGIEQIFQHVGDIDTLETFTSRKYYTNLQILGHSRLLDYATMEQANFLKEYKPLFNHENGLSLKTFQQSTRLMSKFHIVATAIDRSNRTYVALIEGKKIPWYGTQFHPEYSEHLGWMAAFFAAEMKKSTHHGFNPRIDVPVLDGICYNKLGPFHCLKHKR